jgi:uncharacterized membrane protein (DUF485 family)
MTPAGRAKLELLARRRWRLAAGLTATMLVVYFGFILLVAFDKPLMGSPVADGLSVGMLLGALVIGVAWLLTGVYVAWANRRYDVELARVIAESGK